MILSGDAGATKTELALCKVQNGKISILHSERYSSAEFRSLGDIVKKFLSKKNINVDSACIGAPGPKIKKKIISTNLPWILDENKLSRNLNIKNFKLLNDLEALAYSIEQTKKSDLITLHKGKPGNANDNIAVIAPGTGLGQAALIFDVRSNKYIIVPAEGGHSDFAPFNDLEYGLYKFLKKKYGHVSWERVVSGMGIVNIYDYLAATGNYKPDKKLTGRFRSEDKAAVISSDAKAGKSKICVDVLDIFVSALGRQAGNMVMNFKSTGGVYIGGSIPMENISFLKKEIFVKSFLNKGRLSYLTKMTPVYVISDQTSSLKGAAYYSHLNTE
ncbi:MAG TPA: glucokinase [Ignavibacteria bacterium]|nr:glucokinase [Ignavibacteria bacterium]HMR40861.1 glucokinase [Ignavibacteria bacterium]